MVLLELPHLSVLTKVDLLTPESKVQYPLHAMRNPSHTTRIAQPKMIVTLHAESIKNFQSTSTAPNL